MKPEEAAWLAGYMDGDGCVCLGSKSGRSWRSPIIVIDSCDMELLDAARALVGGRLVVKRRYSDRHRQAWSLRLTGADDVISVLTALRPFMRCAAKCERADMLINEWRACTPKNGFYSEADRTAKARFEERFLAIGSDRGSSLRRAA